MESNTSLILLYTLNISGKSLAPMRSASSCGNLTGILLVPIRK